MIQGFRKRGKNYSKIQARNVDKEDLLRELSSNDRWMALMT